jgi:hypothetical protein
MVLTASRGRRRGYVVQTAYAVTVAVFTPVRAVVTTADAVQTVVDVGRDPTSTTRRFACVFVAFAPPPSSTLPAGHVAVALMIVFAAGAVTVVGVPVIICEPDGPVAPVGP